MFKMYNTTAFIGIDKRFIIMPIQKNSIIKFTKNSSHIVLCPSLLVALTLEDSYHCMTNRMNSNQDVKFQGLVFKSNLILILFVMACMSLFATSVVGECDDQTTSAPSDIKCDGVFGDCAIENSEADQSCEDDILGNCKVKLGVQ